MAFESRRERYNSKRKICLDDTKNRKKCETLFTIVKYGGNPEHKKNPNDFGLEPQVGARQGKSLCDEVAIFEKEKAVDLLKEGVRRGMISEQKRNEFPQNIWAVDSNDKPLEAQLENQATGTYHGYPVPESDPMGSEIIEKWNERRR